MGKFSLEGISEKDARATVINWKNNLVAIVDGYRQYVFNLGHAVQKDAVQNGWDARKSKDGKGWSFTFELITHGGTTYLSMTDNGTTGLTGRILTPKDLTEDLPAVEKWGRFENVAFTKSESEKALGSRGRGKFIFVGASKENTICYDTFRNDGTYRFGLRQVELTGSPIYAYENEQAATKLREVTGGAFEPLSTVGTRVIIVEPLGEIIEAIKNGDFVKYINETWWQILSESSAQMVVKYDGKSQNADVPGEFSFPEKDTDTCLVYRIKNKKLKADEDVLTVRELRIAFKRPRPLPKELRGTRLRTGLPDALQGIAVQRGGMKVCSIELKYLPKNLSENIYGFITFDEKTETFLQSAEGPEHYSFDFKKLAPKTIRNFVEAELNQFAEKKLGYKVGLAALEEEKHKDAERKALHAINKILSDMSLFGTKGGGGKEGTTKRPQPPKKPLRLEMGRLPLPSDSQRINYGDVIGPIKLKVINETTKNVEVRVRCSHLLGRKTVLQAFFEQDISIPGKDAHTVEFAEWLCKKGEPKGCHAFRAELVSLMKENKGAFIDVLTKYFWVEEDPPEPGLFGKCEGVSGLPDELKDLQGYSIPQEPSGYAYKYNIEHPAKKAADDYLQDYLVELMAREIPLIDLKEDHRLFQEEQLKEATQIAARSNEIVGRILRQYYRR